VECVVSPPSIAINSRNQVIAREWTSWGHFKGKNFK
jgi:hypothetical protein